MPKTVAVMNGLDHIARALQEQGIRVVDVADTGAAISAMVYSSRLDTSKLAPSAGQATQETGGAIDDMVLMLNADELSVDEILARVQSMW